MEKDGVAMTTIDCFFQAEDDHTFLRAARDLLLLIQVRIVKSSGVKGQFCQSVDHGTG